MTHIKTLQPQQGFTLIELIVVIVILGLLGSIIAPRFLGKTDTARITKVKTDIAALESALELYKLDNFTYPTTDQGLEALVSQPSSDPVPANWQKGGYIKKLRKDPWQRDYLYLSPGERGEIDIYSLGADGVEGGTDANADIGNWDAD